MTRKEAKDIIRAEFNLGQEYDVLLNQYLWWAIRRMAIDLKNLWASTDIALVANQQAYQILGGGTLPDFVAWKYGELSGSPITIGPREAFPGNELTGEMKNSGEKYGFIEDKRLWLVPIPTTSDTGATKSLHVEYWKHAPVPTQDSESLVLGPTYGASEHEELLIAGMRYRVAGGIVRDMNLKAAFLQEYRNELRDSRAFAERQYVEVTGVSSNWPG